MKLNYGNNGSVLLITIFAVALLSAITIGILQLNTEEIQLMRNQIRAAEALTLVEMVIALAIMALVFAAVLPQFRAIQNSWDSKQDSAETLQNGRVLFDHLYRNLSKAVKITAVSGSAETIGYVEFQDNDAYDFRYDVNSTTSYVQFGAVGDLSDLAGPVSQLQFTCYDANDLDTPITDVNAIRCVKVEMTLTNTGSGQDKGFTAWAYLRTNGNNLLELTQGTPFEFESIMGMTPALSKIDNSHYLCAYSGALDDGWAMVLTVDTGTWTITNETPFEFDAEQGVTPALSKIDDTHYLCAYSGANDDGWVKILKVDTGNWTISEEDNKEFDQDKGQTPALVQIDQTHYLCAYAGDGDDGWAVVLTIAAPLFDAISMETPFEFDASNGETSALAKIDDTHYLCAYAGYGDDGWATVLTVDTGTWAITNETPFEFDIKLGFNPALSQMSSTNYLCTYQGYKDTGWAVILKVDTGSWTISMEDAYEFEENYATISALAQLDQTHYLCAHMGAFSHGWAILLASTPSLDTITKQGAGLEFDPDTGLAPTLVEIDDSHYLCAYQGPGEDGWAVVLKTYILRP